MSAAEREKGARGEREVVAKLREFGFTDCARTPNSGGLFITGDVVGVEGFHFEVKRQEQLRLWEWLGQAHREAPPGSTPVVVFRRNGGHWNVALPLEDLLWLMRRASESQHARDLANKRWAK